ncbi:MAG: methionine--tRNA ligase [Oscillospiraceae bacterium]|nr:methionine--tRNA ligase [Oscillospiraceae bacterium]
MDKKTFYITTAIAYASGKPHIGNTYEIVLTDAIARLKRMQGYDVFFCTGTDEHGQKIEEKAAAAGITPKEYVDRVSGQIRGIWDIMNTSYTHFIRTTDDYHEKAVQKIFKRMYEKGDIYKSEYSGMYCTPCESFWTESQLKDGCCPDCGRPVHPAKEEAYFFRMSKYQDRLMKHIEEHPDFIVPESRKKEMINNFLKPGLQDLCVSRTSFKWGIPVDFDDRHVVYVWLDALNNYITALGYDPDGCGENFGKYWPADVHIIGKDILRFHTIYWPIFLMSMDLPLPKQVFGHPWMLFAADKMSKSKGNVIYADDMVHLFGVDAVRYYMLSAMPYAQDGSITYETFITKYNAELANTLGNLVNRTVAMANKYFGGEISAAAIENELDEDLKATALQTAAGVLSSMEEYRTADALQKIIALAQRSNKYIDETTPWALAKDEASLPRLKTVLSNLMEAIRFISVLLCPFLPDTSASILEQINAAEQNTLESLDSFGAAPARKVGEAKVLFARIDEAKMMARIQKEIVEPQIASAKAEEAAKEAAAAPAAETKEETEGLAQITIDDFGKVALRVGKIVACEKLKKSKKLLKIQLEDGAGTRQILSGISQWYAPEDLIGRKVLFVANLKPAKLAGEMSEGMILAADCSETDVKVMFVDDAIPVGAVVR